jgi:hypothetical protein
MANMTILDLEVSTEKVLKSHGVGRSYEPFNYRFENLKANRSKQFKSVTYDCVTHNKDSKGHYNTAIIFYKVEEGELPTLDENPVRVSCSCKAYYFYFSYWNKVAGVHARRPLRAYVRKTETRPEVNPEHLPGACKHILALANYLNGTTDYLLGDVAEYKNVSGEERA